MSSPTIAQRFPWHRFFPDLALWPARPPARLGLSVAVVLQLCWAGALEARPPPRHGGREQDGLWQERGFDVRDPARLGRRQEERRTHM